MNIRDFSNLVLSRMMEQNSELIDINCNGGFQEIIDINFCTECKAFHIITVPTKASIELLKRKG